MDLCLQGSGDLRMRGSQTDRNIAQILVFLDNLFNVLSDIWCEFDMVCCWRGLRVYLGLYFCKDNYTITVYMQIFVFSNLPILPRYIHIVISTIRLA